MAKVIKPVLKDRDHDIVVSTVKFTNVELVSNLEELLHLITNVLHSYSRQKSILVQLRTSKNTITCQLRGKKIATVLARRVEDAFKKYHPEVIINHSKEQDHYDITVDFAGVKP